MYEIIKALHIITVITWFAGLFYLPRLFVYHAMTEDQIGSDRFKVMEYKLFHYIMTPSLVLVLGTGSWIWLAFNFEGGWLHAKLGLVAVLVVYHFFCYRYMVLFAEDKNTKSHKFYRFFNEMPTVVLIVVVFLVVLKPF
ncbi:MAG: TIGR00701 family protein [Candidatus Lambdaproteobacteria bacterium RIFOXYD1_FULL_56_27]|uniref:Protoporphyrinogen IX oxidase n=1 Tax=Candidatus Lambdaproteobacteria bacterium RIFOXYD2_FULL_56_26 TaxID=1817773 RepID=A0A1F6GLR3_9PROT|nr:MAG: TIGR00701 family protein [Candidatus Lambdaproteobacteria bacterium RIFOXYD2_FULL_56_26]OGH01435.1 MAG: TIGR00701 family protein [Candidatus Lambdaproteobacteria bacterium RIFOXYC1_FULL_56_13]OGH07078.1 MAG: TIGR00701 family protein [Candidatus Lambdaproteobacteria bacterium RIFOXYD1_FULL_56_27]